MGLASIVVVLLLTATGLELRHEFARAAALRQAVERSYDARLQIQSVFSLVQDAETGQRGYIITGNEAFLEPYDQALGQLDAQIGVLVNLLRVDQEQTDNQRRLSGRIAQKRREMQRTIDLRRSGRSQAAITLVTSGRGKATMDQIRRIVDRMTQREAELLSNLSADARERTRRTEFLVTLMFKALVLTALGTAFLIWRYLATRSALLERLGAAAARHGATLDSAFDGIITLNPSGTIETLNPAAERLFGWAAQEIDRRDVGLLVDLAENGEGAFLERLGASHGDLEQGLKLELTGKRRNGERFPVDVALAAMDLPTGRHVVAVIHDATERRRIAEMKDAFVSTVSHELRTPLTSIAGSLGLVAAGAGGQMPEKAARLIDIAHANSRRLVRLINDILDVEKLEAGELKMAMAALDLREVAAQAVEGIHGYADQMGVPLNLNDGPPAPVRGDADRLIQVVTNLLSNAVKFSPSGSEVRVTVNPEARIARLSVADRGSGIADEFRSRIFGKFAQADSTDAREKGGTGLGLAIAKEIAERHAGRLWFESAEGEGSTFHLDLPLDQPDKKTAEEEALRLLICEDDPDAARTLVEMLSYEGFKTDVAATGREALSMARRTPYAAALIDLHLPDVDGVRLIRDLKADEDTRPMPLVVVSGDVAGGRVRGRSLQVADWVEKPVDQERLRLAVRSVVGADKRPVVLHVDDDRDILEVTRHALGAVEVIPVESLAAARETLARRRPDLVILDLGLPDGNGLDLLPLLTEEDGRTIPIVIYSAQEMDREAAPAVQAVLTKSRMSLTQLARTVHRLTPPARGRS